jgi:polygalacturonase
VRLVPADGGKTVVITPDAVNPYCVDFSVPLSVAAGNYYVEVSANSAEYGRDLVREYPEVVKATVVQVEPAPTNPTALALKVAWANDFNWTRVADAKRDFHAQGDGSTDDTRAIQNALDHVSQSGGGVVFLPQGVYKVNNLVLGSKCILQGESREETVVMVSKIGDDGAIVPKGSAQGMSTMTLKYQPSVSARSSALLIAGAANKFFIHNIKFDVSDKSPE